MFTSIHAFLSFDCGTLTGFFVARDGEVKLGRSDTVVSRLLVPIAICSLHSITRHVINERHTSSFRIQNSNCVSTLRSTVSWTESDGLLLYHAEGIFQ